MSAGAEYKIKFVGLSPGKHRFDYEIGPGFFSAFEYGEIRDGRLSVHLDLDKAPNMMTLKFFISGEVHSLCDRCADRLALPLQGENGLIIKYGDEPMHNTDELLVLPGSVSEIDVSAPLYEFIHLLLPQRRVHPEGGCDPLVVDMLDDLSPERQSPGGDPRWDALRKLVGANIKN